MKQTVGWLSVRGQVRRRAWNGLMSVAFLTNCIVKLRGCTHRLIHHNNNVSLFALLFDMISKLNNRYLYKDVNISMGPLLFLI